MKKIIKIAALILALICISTSITSCGNKNSNSNEENLNNVFTQTNQEENLKFLAAQIKNNITLTIDTIDYVNASNNFSITYQPSMLISDKNLNGDTLKEYSVADINQRGIYFSLNENTYILKIKFLNARLFNDFNKAKTTITINLPIETDDVLYDDTKFNVTVSPDKKSIILEYVFDPSSDTNKSILINSDIFIFY